MAMENKADLVTHVERTEHIFPQDRERVADTTALSAIDNTVVNFSSAGAVWFYGPSELSETTVSVEDLRAALRSTLNYYPQFCGHLHWLPATRDERGSLKWSRLAVGHSTNYENDPGVELTIATTKTDMRSLVPSSAERRQNDEAWNAGQVPYEKLMSSSMMAPGPDSSSPGSEVIPNTRKTPAMLIQVTAFGCGGKAIAVKAAHPLADAMALSHFVRDWAERTRAVSKGVAEQSLYSTTSWSPPVFDPASLDAYADRNSDMHDPAIIRVARGLPCHRYDWWDPQSAAGCFFPAPTAAPKDFKEVNVLLEDQGVSMPWSDWDVTLPVAHYIIHFSRHAVQAMWSAATSEHPTVSKHDAIVAHIWACINHARGLQQDSGLVHLDMTLGLRRRLQPPLSEKFMGSPIMLADVAASGHDVTEEHIGAVARRIKETVAIFTADKVAAHVHDKLHVAVPQRISPAFQGRRHIILTSWVHTGVRDVDFGDGTPVYCEAIMPASDGCVQITEAIPINKEVGESKAWWQDGVDVSIHVAEETMRRMLAGPFLRKYDGDNQNRKD